MKNVINLLFYSVFLSLCFIAFIFLYHNLPIYLQYCICKISGFFTIVVMLILLFLLFGSMKLIKSNITKLGMLGAIGTIIMYSLWLSLDYGAKHPYASATGFNIAEITLGIVCSFLVLDKIIKKGK